MTHEWHLQKSVPVGLIITLIIQFSYVIWFTSKLDSRVSNIEGWQIETKQNRFTSAQGELLEKRIVVIESNISSLDNKIDTIKNNVTKILTILEYSEIEGVDKKK